MMKKIKITFALFAVMMLIMNSCTVQRRYHRKGFNIQWNQQSNGIAKEEIQKKQGFDDLSEKEEIQMLNDNYSITQFDKSTIENDYSENKKYEITSSDNVELTRIKKNNKSLSSADIQSIEKSKINSSLIQEFKRKTSEIESKEAKKKPLNGWALTSFILSILSLFASFYGALLCAALVIIFSEIADKQMKKSPDKYRGAKLTQAALVIVTIAMTLWTVVFLIL